ncbi:FAD-dependent oxidoreductase, partial [Clostridioides difficile]
MSKVIVVGGGASGMMAALSASKNNNEVILVERNGELGRKLRATGGGRCNFTNNR